MNRSILVAGLLGASLASALATPAFAWSSPNTAAPSSGGYILICPFKKTNPARPPQKLTETDAGPCIVFGAIADAGAGASAFTLLGNPVAGLRGKFHFAGKLGSLWGRFQGPTAPIAFSPGPKPTVVEAVAITTFTVTEATGAYETLEGKSGVSAAHADNKRGTVQVSILLP